MNKRMAASCRGGEVTRWRLHRIIGLWVLLVTAGSLLAACQPQPATSLPAALAPATSLPATSAPATTVPASLAPAQPMPAEVTAAEALAKREQGAFILDVRQPEEWAQYHVPGSTLIPLGELASRVNEVPSDREVVVVCRSGNRSATGRDILIKAGLPWVSSLKGGLSEWKTQGFPTVAGQ
jgi:rhodanese-related sulfurtransferase